MLIFYDLQIKVCRMLYKMNLDYSKYIFFEIENSLLDDLCHNTIP